MQQLRPPFRQLRSPSPTFTSRSAKKESCGCGAATPVARPTSIPGTSVRSVSQRTPPGSRAAGRGPFTPLPSCTAGRLRHSATAHPTCRSSWSLRRGPGCHRTWWSANPTRQHQRGMAVWVVFRGPGRQLHHPPFPPGFLMSFVEASGGDFLNGGTAAGHRSARSAWRDGEAGGPWVGWDPASSLSDISAQSNGPATHRGHQGDGPDDSRLPGARPFRFSATITLR